MAACKHCRAKNAPLKINLNSFCSMEHAIEYAKTQQNKLRAAKERQAKQVIKERKQSDRKRLEQLKRPSEHAAEAQGLFNKMRRLEELLWFAQHGLEPICISCQKPLGDDQWACGHYKTRGARKDLAFERLNAHLQHNFNCNKNKSGDIEGQKVGYALRYGEEEAQRILADLEVHRNMPKRTPDEWLEMKKEFRAEIRRLEKLITGQST